MQIENRELLEISTHLEETVQKVYEGLSRRIDHPIIRNYLRLMARDEAHHEKHFEEILNAGGGRHYGWEDSRRLRGLVDHQIKQDLFPKLDRLATSLDDSPDIAQALAVCLQCEEVAVEFYGLLRAACREVETKSVLIEMESEEKSHRDYVEALINFWKQASR